MTERTNALAYLALHGNTKRINTEVHKKYRNTKNYVEIPKSTTWLSPRLNWVDSLPQLKHIYQKGVVAMLVKLTLVNLLPTR
jgi:hypothetical protein